MTRFRRWRRQWPTHNSRRFTLFVDGNGRTGRALFHLALRRRGLGARFLPPASLVLATWSRDCIVGLTGNRYAGAPSSTAAQRRNRSEDAGLFEERIRSLQSSWHKRLTYIRRDSSARALIESLPASPVLTVSSAEELLGRSFQAANQNVGRLMEDDVLVQVTVGRRNRAFEAPELIEAFTTLKRQLASPEGETSVSGSARYVPRRQG